MIMKYMNSSFKILENFSVWFQIWYGVDHQKQIFNTTASCIMYLRMKWMTGLWPSAILLKLQPVTLQRLIMCSEVKADNNTIFMLNKQMFYFIKKDINDLNGLHGNRKGGATVTFILNNHHEQVTAGNLLNYKGPERTSTNKKIKK